MGVVFYLVRPSTCSALPCLFDVGIFRGRTAREHEFTMFTYNRQLRTVDVYYGYSQFW